MEDLVRNSIIGALLIAVLPFTIGTYLCTLIEKAEKQNDERDSQ